MGAVKAAPREDFYNQEIAGASGAGYGETYALNNKYLAESGEFGQKIRTY